MTTRPFDAETYKSGQRRDWSTVASGWDRWWRTIEKGLAPVSERLIELAEIRPGQSVLDIATGIGEPALTAGVVVGPSGRVTATDIAQGMLGVAQKRAADAGITNVEFLEMDAEALDVPAGAFDAVLCRFGLMFLPNLGQALERMRVALNDGGSVSAAVWGPAERVPAVSVTMRAVTQELQLAPPPPGAPGLFSLGNPSALEESLAQAGFADVRTETLNIAWEFESTDHYIQYLKDVAAPIKNLLANHEQQRRDDVWRAIAEANRQFETPDGSLRLEGESLLVAGRR